ncbi:pyruvate, phosphate dikinase [Loigolactobacillus backii]|uniref:Pyruvate, phosphate dikinase n=1 Tax=Loigolactobacillus backii TaxID=375175 RepID=A0A192H1U1_9LACO|nr:pyruvate, phosphate dikinase [Loigolactobacillus backii]ANK62330.1 pyruvate, phosphate dikinase [Loigolactobacillus backii]ANK70657.1 pyruvate, phosphate dikinase [Loigolactobacillus backii]MDA5387931.1 pyruvate, phosphate dikinase [Loigolactobacillus backii]MDA5390432.1 pyruvate, phosphate dikinase [Loigolactobacillus backii]
MKQIYFFAEGNRDMRALLGGKGANLAEMTGLGLPVPSGFTVTTDACHQYQTNNNNMTSQLEEELKDALQHLEEQTGKLFDNTANPLLVSVRSGAAISMPGMMDTILNLGLNDQTVLGLAKQTNNERFAWDCYRRLLQMFGNVVFGIPEKTFDNEMTKLKQAKHYQSDLELTTADLKQLAQQFKALYTATEHKAFPQNPHEQLQLAVDAVFSSWQNNRAKVYRKLHGIPETLGTAVNVQMMAFGNSGQDSGTGVAFTRNPVTGEAKLFGEFLKNAQGEDVVSGLRTPQPIHELADSDPEIYQQFVDSVQELENHYRDMQDVEFTIEHGKLYFLQTRNGKRTPKAAVQIAVDLVEEGKISEAEALMRVDPEQITQLLHPEFAVDDLKGKAALAKGLPASPGAASGQIYFTAASAKAAHEAGHQVVLVRQDTSPEDIEGMVVSEAIVTSRGGMTSHAAVVARGMGKCGVVGCAAITIESDKSVKIGEQTFHEGDNLSVDGTTGKLYAGILSTTKAAQDPNLQKFLQWAQKNGNVDVFANADTPADFEQALRFGAKGIGLTRTEHMFFKSERLFQMRRLIIARTADDRIDPLNKLREMQQKDFVALYRLAEGKNVTIRLLDPPLHEFLPHDEVELKEVATAMNVSVDKLRNRVAELKEVNPMLGHRGCRLAVTYPDIYEMQVTAIANAALQVRSEGINVKPHIMIPLIGSLVEMRWVKDRLVAKLNEVFATTKQPLHYQIGTMIEMPRACLVADQIAQEADFFSFGTNDLTQLTYGFSRDDSGSFLPDYIEKGLLPADPFKSLDQEGVGALMKMAVNGGRKEKRSLPIGVCGELGGDPESIKFFDAIGIDYVSCSPYRVPVAVLASAQAAINRRHQPSFAKSTPTTH